MHFVPEEYFSFLFTIIKKGNRCSGRPFHRRVHKLNNILKLLEQTTIRPYLQCAFCYVTKINTFVSFVMLFKLKSKEPNDDFIEMVRLFYIKYK